MIAVYISFGLVAYLILSCYVALLDIKNKKLLAFAMAFWPATFLIVLFILPFMIWKAATDD